jgi:hypothetical protein
MTIAPASYRDINGAEWVIVDTSIAPWWPSSAKYQASTAGYLVEGSLAENTWEPLQKAIEAFALANKANLRPAPVIPTTLPPPATTEKPPDAITSADRPEAHRWARPIMLAAVPPETPPGPGIPLSGLQAMQAIASLETLYSLLWVGSMVGSNNWGADHCPHAKASDGSCGAGCRAGTDSGEPACFAEYGSPLDGAKGMAAQLWKRKAVQAQIKAGKVQARKLARAMWDSSYFGDKEHPEQVEVYAQAILSNASEIAAANGEALWVTLGDTSDLPAGAGATGAKIPWWGYALGGAALLGVGVAVATR